jgi:hypothetical protein
MIYQLFKKRQNLVMIWIQIRTGMALWIRSGTLLKLLLIRKTVPNKSKIFFAHSRNIINTQNEVLQEEIYMHKTVQIINYWDKY